VQQRLRLRCGSGAGRTLHGPGECQCRPFLVGPPESGSSRTADFAHGVCLGAPSQVMIGLKPFQVMIGCLGAPSQVMIGLKPFQVMTGCLGAPSQVMIGLKPFQVMIGCLGAPSQVMIGLNHSIQSPLIALP